MEINSSDFFNFLIEKGVTHLHHANTVTTSCTFLRKQQLIARGCMERDGENQTAQASDDNDKAQGVYFDLFLDSVDIHDRARKRNVYGPVMFKISVEKLLAMNLAPVWITKSNPMYWKEQTTQLEKWFQSLDEIKSEFVVGRFNQMVVLRHVGGVLNLNECLEEIVIDDPNIMKKSYDLFVLSVGAIMLARSASKIPLKAKVAKRQCADGCKCLAEYESMGKDALELFVPTRTTPAPES